MDTQNAVAVIEKAIAEKTQLAEEAKSAGNKRDAEFWLKMVAEFTALIVAINEAARIFRGNHL